MDIFKRDLVGRLKGVGDYISEAEEEEGMVCFEGPSAALQRGREVEKVWDD